MTFDHAAKPVSFWGAGVCATALPPKARIRAAGMAYLMFIVGLSLSLCYGLPVGANYPTHYPAGLQRRPPVLLPVYDRSAKGVICKLKGGLECPISFAAPRSGFRS